METQATPRQVLAAAKALVASAPWPAPGDRLDALLGQILDRVVEGVGLVLHGAGRPVGGGSHVVVSPAGVDIVHLRIDRGRVRVASAGFGGPSRAIFLDDLDRTDMLTALDRVVDTVRAALDHTQVDVSVRGWLCLGGADWQSEPLGVRVGGYRVIPAAALPELLNTDGPHWAVRSLAVIVGKALGQEPDWEDLARSWAAAPPAGEPARSHRRHLGRAEHAA